MYSCVVLFFAILAFTCPVALNAGGEGDECTTGHVCSDGGPSLVQVKHYTAASADVDAPDGNVDDDAALVKEGLMTERLRCNSDDESGCVCKEILLTAICAMREEKGRWSAALPSIDSNGDGLVDSEEWQVIGTALPRTPEDGGEAPPGDHIIGMMQSRQEQPLPIAELIPELTRAVGDAYDRLLSQKSCTEALEDKVNFWDEAIFHSPGDLHQLDDKCAQAFRMGEPDTSIVAIEEEAEPFTATGAVSTHGEAALLQVDMSHLSGLEAAKHRLDTEDAATMIRHDIDVSAIKYDMDVSQYINFSAFSGMGKMERALAKEMAWASNAKAVSALLVAQFCWKDTWAKRTTHLRCKSGWYQGSSIDVGFCYKHCNRGYSRFGDHCWGHCPSGWTDLGVTCTKQWCDGSCWWPWNLRISTREKHIYYEPGCSITSSRCSGCPAGFYMAGLRCYENCKAGYSCTTRASLTGLMKCRGNLGTDCGFACASDTAACIANTFEILQGLLEAVVNIAMLCLTFGASSSAVLAKNTMEQMATQTAKNARRITVVVSRESFKKQLRKNRYNIIKDAIKDNMQGNVVDKGKQLYVAYAFSESDTLSEYYIEKFKEEESAARRREKIVADIDPTGIATAILSHTGDSADDSNKQAANWLSVAAFVDPTGITGAIAGIIKHSMCEHTLSKMKEIEESSSSYSSGRSGRGRR